MAIGTATLKSLVQCNVGDKRPVLLCALLPNATESLQLDLEFDEAEDVVFSVVGPRGVYLTGYYVGHNRHSNMQDESYPFVVNGFLCVIILHHEFLYFHALVDMIAHNFIFPSLWIQRESYGEDIANSETRESDRCSDEDEYEDSFINDDEPEPVTPSPVSSNQGILTVLCFNKEGLYKVY